MTTNEIIIRGARQHNLKDIEVRIPRDHLVVITGVSGSGKSSLALDTLFAEGQRRYLESLSSYARQFVGQLDKPDVDSVDGLSPAVAIDQRSLGRNPRSTTGTATEIYDFLRLLFAQVGEAHCPRCGRRISAVSLDQMRQRLIQMPRGTRIDLFAPIVRNEAGAHRRVLQRLARDGYLRIRLDGAVRELTEDIRLPRHVPHSIDVLVDRLEIRPGISTRLTDSLETAIRLSGGMVQVHRHDGESLWFSERPMCVPCQLVIPQLIPKLFSFNDPLGACPACRGLGYQCDFDPNLIVPDPKKSLREGALAPLSKGLDVRYMEELEALGEYYGFDIQSPFESLPGKARQVLLFGPENHTISLSRTGLRGTLGDARQFTGVIPWLKDALRNASDRVTKTALERFMSRRACTHCDGTRLRPEARSVRVGGKSLEELCSFSISGLIHVLNDLALEPERRALCREILKTVVHRLKLLEALGLQYLSLDRSSETLSGGEAQRVRLASQMGSNLAGILYILDEPSVGLHPQDQATLLNTLRALMRGGNTVVVVEHDAATIRAADHVVDMGPGAGETGGYVIYSGPPTGLLNCTRSLTGAYLAGRRQISIPPKRRSVHGPALELIGASEHNLKGIDVRIPRGCLTCVTGVSGSGKSSLVLDTLFEWAAGEVNRSPRRMPKVHRVRGLEAIERVVDVDQSPIGRTPRSNPATYTGIFRLIRSLFAQLPESRVRGYRSGRYSFNVKGGRCEACRGEGVRRIEMHLLPDVYATCEVCKGARYNFETLEVRYKGMNVAQTLELTVDEASRVFENMQKIGEILNTLQAVGLGYLRLGQPANTLSGGEAQRLKLTRELSRRQRGRTLYVLDEPTTGLHFEDIRYLLEVLGALVDAGNTVVIIEHNLEVVKCADYVIDLGPGAGDEGGWVVACGTPEEVVDTPNAPTAAYLKEVLNPTPCPG